VFALLGPVACDGGDDERDERFDDPEALVADHVPDQAFALATGHDEPVPAAPQLRVLLTDAPLDVDSVYVTISEVRVQTCVDDDPDAEGGCTGGWLSLAEQEATFDLLTLQDGITEELGVAQLPEGDYGQIRLKLVDASVVVDGEVFALTVPSGAQSGIKLNHGFTLEAGMQTTITLDFDAGESVHYAPGNGWMMQPVIDIIADVSEPIEEPGDDEPAEGDATP
jgi:hypothetical protein